MRISDWSSDVCSSDLRLGVDRFQFRNVRRVGVSSIEGIKHADKFFIGGEWVSPSTSSKIDVINPATEEVFLTVAEAHEADINRAVASARDAFDHGPWPRMSRSEEHTSELQSLMRISYAVF